MVNKRLATKLLLHQQVASATLQLKEPEIDSFPSSTCSASTLNTIFHSTNFRKQSSHNINFVWISLVCYKIYDVCISHFSLNY